MQKTQLCQSSLCQFICEYDLSLEKSMSKYVNDLGSRLFHSVANRAGDLGEKFEEEFSYLAQNITADVDDIVNEAISLSPFIKVALVCLSILLVILSVRYLAFGIRVLIDKRRRMQWMKFEYDKALPPVILMIPSADGVYENARVLRDDDAKNILKQLPGADPAQALLQEFKQQQMKRGFVV